MDKREGWVNEPGRLSEIECPGELPAEGSEGASEALLAFLPVAAPLGLDFLLLPEGAALLNVFTLFFLGGPSFACGWFRLLKLRSAGVSRV
jgi:hypothetical protein